MVCSKLMFYRKFFTCTVGGIGYRRYRSVLRAVGRKLGASWANFVSAVPGPLGDTTV
jgi:hypothetical protein